MTKSKSSVSSIVFSSIAVIYSVNDAQFLNDTCVIGAVTTVISPVSKI